MKNLITIFLFIIGLTTNFSYAQSDELLAKSYFLKAQQAYSEGNNTIAIENLDKTLEYLSTTNAKIEALYVKIAVYKENYIAAENHLGTYFEIADEGHSDYMEMLGYVAEVKEKIAKKKAEEAEYKSKREQKIYNEVVEYFENNNQLCCEYPSDRTALEWTWSDAVSALQAVVSKGVYGESIKNDTLFQTATSVNMPLNEFKNMTFKVSEAKPNTFSITSSQLTIKSIYGNQIDVIVEGRLNPTFVKNVKETLLNVVQQKRVIKYLREHPDKFPEKSQLLNEESYLFAYDGRKEYDEDLKKEVLIEKSSNPQNNNEPKKTEPLKDRPSSFIGGKTALLNYFSDNIQYPEEAIASQVEGKVYVSFTVSKDGSLREIKVMRGPGFGLNKEAVRLIQNMPKWEPAIEQGKLIATKINLPLNFELPKDSISEEKATLDFWKKAENSLTKAKEENWSTLNQNRYTIKYPNSWKMNKENVPNAEFVLTKVKITPSKKVALVSPQRGPLTA